MRIKFNALPPYGNGEIQHSAWSQYSLQGVHELETRHRLTWIGISPKAEVFSSVKTRQRFNAVVPDTLQFCCIVLKKSQTARVAF